MTQRLSLVFLILALTGCYNVEQSQIERGFRWIGRGNTQKALSSFDRVIQKNPKSVLAFTGRGDAYFFAKKDSEAIEAYSRALALLQQTPVSSEKNGDQETIGHRFLSYQNQGLSFPFGLTAFLHVRRGTAIHSLGVVAQGAQRHELLEMADADLSRALEIAPHYQYAIDARNRLLEDRERKPIQSPKPTTASAAVDRSVFHQSKPHT